MSVCKFCEQDVASTHMCRYCGHFFCFEHKLPSDHNCSRLEVWAEEMEKIRSKEIHKKSFFRKKEMSLARRYLLERERQAITPPKTRKRKKGIKLFLFVLSSAIFIVGFFYFMPELSKLFSSGFGASSASGGKYTVPAYPGSMGTELAEGTLTPENTDCRCYVTSQSSNQVLQWYSSQMNGWTVKNDNNLNMSGILYNYVCWKRENAGAMIYTVEISGQTTVIAAVGPWYTFENYTPNFLSSQEEQGESGEPEYPEPGQ